MAFRRGFKSQCERRSVEFRRQLGIQPEEALCADDLARTLDVTVWSTSDVAALSEDNLAILNDDSDDSWAALTLRIGTKNLVVHKITPSIGRRNAVIMHELAHIVLGHELSEACILEDGSLVPGNFSQEQEDEADWLAGALLLPRPALMSIRKRYLSDQEACSQYIVSKAMLMWRLTMSSLRRR